MFYTVHGEQDHGSNKDAGSSIMRNLEHLLEQDEFYRLRELSSLHYWGCAIRHFLVEKMPVVV